MIPVAVALIVMAVAAIAVAWREISDLLTWSRTEADRADELAAGIDPVEARASEGGLCISCTSTDPSRQPLLAHPDGGPGGVCRPCHEVLDR